MPLRSAFRLATLAVAFALHPAVRAEGSPPPKPFIGSTLAQVQASGFSQFFHLAPVLQRPDGAHPGMVLNIFGTTGDFKGYVNLLLTTAEGDDTVRLVGLMVRRDFVDGERTAVFARDIVKSFLEATTVSAAPPIKTLHADLWACKTGGGADCDLNAPAYLVYLGRQDKLRMDAPGGYVQLQNSQVMQVPMLFVENGTQ